MTENEAIIATLTVLSFFFFTLFFITYRAYYKLFEKNLTSVLPTAAPEIIEEDKYDIVELISEKRTNEFSQAPVQVVINQLKNAAAISLFNEMEECGALVTDIKQKNGFHEHQQVCFKIKVAIKK